MTTDEHFIKYVQDRLFHGIPIQEIRNLKRTVKIVLRVPPENYYYIWRQHSRTEEENKRLGLAHHELKNLNEKYFRMGKRLVVLPAPRYDTEDTGPF
jgi:hypothetical protein